MFTCHCNSDAEIQQKTNNWGQVVDWNGIQIVHKASDNQPGETQRVRVDQQLMSWLVDPIFSGYYQ